MRKQDKKYRYGFLKDILDTLGLPYEIVTPLDKYLLEETPDNASLFSWGKWGYYCDGGVRKREKK